MVAPHVLAIPYPAQGHVIPLMEIVLLLVNRGIRITFVNTVFNHERVVQSLSDAKIKVPELMNLVSLPDGMELYENRNDFGKLTESVIEVMPEKLEALIYGINNGSGGDDKITCLIADEHMGWALDVGEKMGIRTRIAFWPASAAILALKFNFQRLIDEGIIDSTGSVLKKNPMMIQLSPGMPVMDPEEFSWLRISDENSRKVWFRLMEMNNRTIKKADWVICNTSETLEKATLNSFPELLPIGPLLSNNRLGKGGKTLGSFWSEDYDCLAWLDEQPPQSVVYVAFGSITVFDQTQFHEIALGLELSNRRFLLVVRPDLLNTDADKPNNDAYPPGFRSRILERGRLSSWVPQQDVLSHPSLACFVSHCGWNSTIEGISNGMPFLCWPYLGDQFLNRSYICDIWKVGLGFNRNGNGIIESGEIKNKIDQLLGDESFRTRALELKAGLQDDLKEDGSSGKNFMNIINSIN